MKNTKTIIEVENLNFDYDKTNVLENITFKVHKGDFLGLVGPNGSGKTTLLRLILGLNKPKTGTIKLFKKKINKFKDYAKIGYVPQKATNIDQTFPATVKEIIATGAMHKVTDKEIQNTLKTVNMLEFTNRKIGKLSGGQQQRIFIARALLNKPELLILDEPTTGVDQQSRNTFYELLHQLNKKGMTIILVSHDTGTITKYVNKVACLNKTLYFHGTHKEFCIANEPEKIQNKYHVLNHEH